MQVGESYQVVIGETSEEITIEEVSSTYGDAQSSMPGGDMNGGGRHSRGGSKEDATGDGTAGSTADSGDGVAADNTQGTPPQKPEDMQGGTGDGATQAVSQESSQDQPSDGSEQELSQNEEDQAAEQTVTAQPVDHQTWAIIGGCTFVLIAAIVIGKIYKRH